MAVTLPDGRRRDLLVSTAPIRDQRGEITGAVGALRDITEHEDARRALLARTAQLEALRDIGLEIGGQLDLAALLRSVVSHATRLLEMDSGAIYLHRPERDVLELAASVNMPELPERFTIRRGDGMIGAVWSTGQPTMLREYQNWSGRLAIMVGDTEVPEWACQSGGAMSSSE